MAFQDYPGEIFASLPEGKQVRYWRVDGMFAVHGDDGTRIDLPVEMALEDPLVAVYQGAPQGDLAANDSVTPVYAMDGGGIGVPTGLVFVRFNEGADAAARAPDLSALGYRMDSVPGYAPNAAWLRSASGDVAFALRQLLQLAQLDGIAVVEPQLVTAVGRR